jgi:hypothetical protein
MHKHGLQHKHRSLDAHGDDEFGAEAAAAKSKIKVPAVAATVAGAAIGIPFGPIGIGAGFAIGAMIDLIRHKKAPAAAAKPGDAPAAPASPPPPLTPAMTNVMIFSSTASKMAPLPPMILHPAIKSAHAAPVPTPTAMASASTAAAAAPIPEVTILQNYFHRYPGDRVLGDMFWKTTQMEYMVKSFQSAFNKETAAVKALGALPETGLFGHRTAAAYTFYTHETIEPDPSGADDS